MNMVDMSLFEVIQTEILMESSKWKGVSVWNSVKKVLGPHALNLKS